MAQKYEIIYNDVANVSHNVQIFDNAYAGQPIDVLGRAFLDASSAEDNLEAIRGLGLRVELEANQDLTYSDLYTEEEKTFPVKYYRNSVLIFDGLSLVVVPNISLDSLKPVLVMHPTG